VCNAGQFGWALMLQSILLVAVHKLLGSDFPLVLQEKHLHCSPTGTTEVTIGSWTIITDRQKDRPTSQLGCVLLS